jgi:hypothetical protein
MIETLKEAAVAYGTVIGFQDSEPPPYDKHINIILTHATLAQTMDAIVRADSRYAWRQEPSGSVRVFSQNARFTLPGVVVSSLKIEQLGKQQIADALNSNPDVVRWGHKESALWTEEWPYLVVCRSTPSKFQSQTTERLSAKTLMRSCRSWERITGS